MLTNSFVIIVKSQVQTSLIGGTGPLYKVGKYTNLLFLCYYCIRSTNNYYY